MFSISHIWRVQYKKKNHVELIKEFRKNKFLKIKNMTFLLKVGKISSTNDISY